MRKILAFGCLALIVALSVGVLIIWTVLTPDPTPTPTQTTVIPTTAIPTKTPVPTTAVPATAVPTTAVPTATKTPVPTTVPTTAVPTETPTPTPFAGGCNCNEANGEYYKIYPGCAIRCGGSSKDND